MIICAPSAIVDDADLEPDPPPSAEAVARALATLRAERDGARESLRQCEAPARRQAAALSDQAETIERLRAELANQQDAFAVVDDRCLRAERTARGLGHLLADVTLRQIADSEAPT